MSVDTASYRHVMGHFATGVCVITAPGPVGMTANAVCSVSLQPQLLLVCFARDARTLPVVRESGVFGVNVLASHQRELARLFASKAPESQKFAGVAHVVDADVPILDGALAWVSCKLTELVEAGDHEIAIGAVHSAGAGAGEPLVWFRGEYR